MRKTIMLLISIFWLTGSLLAQNRTITGKVSDEKGVPVPFASVMIKGKPGTGTTTNQAGAFTSSAAKGDVLVISGVSYAPKEVTVGTGNLISLQLAPAKEDLSEVVVTAMGIKRSEKALGYAVSKVDPSTMLQKSEPN